MRSACFKQKGLQSENLMLNYKELVTRFVELCNCTDQIPDDECERLDNIVSKILLLRHAIIHKGFPNILPVAFENKYRRYWPKQVKEAQVKKLFDWYSNPSNFNEIKEDFSFLVRVIRKLPRVTIRG